MREQRRYGRGAVAGRGDSPVITTSRAEPVIQDGSQEREREPLLPGKNNGRRDGYAGRGWDGCCVVPDAVRNVTGDPFAKGSHRRDNGRILTTILLLNYMIGSGILNSPQVFSDSGVAAATILYITAGACAYMYSCLFVGDCVYVLGCLCICSPANR